jgi:Protein of unknown function (DUF1570)
MAYHPRRPHDRPKPRVAGIWVVACGVALGSIGCATLGGDVGKPLVPSKVHARTGPFEIYTSQPLTADAPPVRALKDLEKDVAASLGVRAPDDAPPVEVYVLNDRESFAHFLQIYYPELPPRRAFFLAQGPRRVVYTFENDRLREDLRHEAAHALLHLAVGDLPLWLDEGLAEYFENPDSHQGVNPEHMARLPDDTKGGWRPDLARLESLKIVSEMSPRDYRESWAWVHYLLNSTPEGKTTLFAYLNDLRKSSETPALSVRLASIEKSADTHMLVHIERLHVPAPLAVAETPRGAARIGLQDAPIDPRDIELRKTANVAPSPPLRRGFFTRLFGFFGKGDAD